MEVLLTESKQDKCNNLVIQRAALVVALNRTSTTTGITTTASSAVCLTMIDTAFDFCFLVPSTGLSSSSGRDSTCQQQIGASLLKMPWPLELLSLLVALLPSPGGTM